MKAHPEITGLFIGVWIALGMVGAWVLYLDKNIVRKRRLRPLFIIGSAVTFALFTFLISGDLGSMAIVLPALVVITFLNLRQFKVCSSCGRTIHSGLRFTKATYCLKCGERLG
jgi:hypothetical protein